MIAAAPQIVALRLDVAMPSIFARGVCGWSQRREVAPYREKLVVLLLASGPAVEAGRVLARITISHPDRRSRKPENWEPLAARATWEALLEAGWIVGRDRVVVESVEMAHGDPETLIELTIEEGE